MSHPDNLSFSVGLGHEIRNLIRPLHDHTPPPEFEPVFERAWQAEDELLLHRSFKLWKNRLSLSAELNLFWSLREHGLFALHNPRDKIVRSIADVAPADVSRVKLVRKVAAAWGWHVFFARLRAVWRGPRECSPNRGPIPDDEIRFVTDGPGGAPPGSLAALTARFQPVPPDGIHDITNYPDPDLDHGVGFGTQGILEMHDMDGTSVVNQRDSFWPDAEEHKREVMFLVEHGMIQRDFLDFDPDTEKTTRTKHEGEVHVEVEQTWYKNVGHPLRVFHRACTLPWA